MRLCLRPRPPAVAALSLWLALAGCKTKNATPDTGDTSPPEFCEQISDGGTYQTDVGGSAAAGDLEMHLITNEDVDVRNPLYIAFKDYTLENIETGGIQQTGQTTGDGLAFVPGLGPGTWLFRASFARGSTICTAELEVPVAVEQKFVGCAVMICP
jgi:hypothetical protein